MNKDTMEAAIEDVRAAADQEELRSCPGSAGGDFGGSVGPQIFLGPIAALTISARRMNGAIISMGFQSRSDGQRLST